MNQFVKLNEETQSSIKPIHNPFVTEFDHRDQRNDKCIKNDSVWTYVDEINYRTMTSLDALKKYSMVSGLKAAEKAVLNTIRAEIKDQPILDIGVGGGRTTEALMEISRQYIGVDYSKEMVNICRNRFSGVDFRNADARDLSQFDDNYFALVVFSCEGLCMVDHDGRLKILNEVRRVLKRGGIFLFSTMNQNSDYHDRPFQFPVFKMTSNPARLVIRSVRFGYKTVNRLIKRIKNKRKDLRTEDYSIINDVYHDYSTMIYYISLANQRKQLDSVGFKPNACVYNLKGEFISADSRDNTLTFVARK